MTGKPCLFNLYIDGLVQERRKSIPNALVLYLSWTNPSIWGVLFQKQYREQEQAAPVSVRCKYLFLRFIPASGTTLVLGLRPTNERLRYFVTTSLIDCAQA